MNGTEERFGTTTTTEESVADLLRDLRDESMVLIRQQVELAKAETSEKVSKAARNAAYVVAGGVITYTGVLFLLFGLNFLGVYGLVAAGLSEGIAVWLMPLIIGAIVTLVGALYVAKAIKTLKHTSLVPKKTTHSLKEDRQWLSRKQR